MKTYEVPSRRAMLPATSLRRRKPRRYTEWKVLRQWEMIPSWEVNPPGYLLREARESAGITQQLLASVLGCSRQAISRAERFDSTPPLEFTNAWTAALGLKLLRGWVNTHSRKRAHAVVLVSQVVPDPTPIGRERGAGYLISR